MVWRFGIVKMDNFFTVEEVYYDKDIKKPGCYTERLSSASGESKQEVLDSLQMSIDDINRTGGYFEFIEDKLVFKEWDE